MQHLVDVDKHHNCSERIHQWSSTRHFDFLYFISYRWI